jgi:pyruvate ferredoxin oxidoreductase gamma subunit
MGAPITAFNRISDEKIRIHSNIYEPDYVVVIDESLLECVDVTAGLKSTGAIIVNTHKSPDELKKAHEALRGFKGKVCTIDARAISVDCLGRYFPNTPTLAAVVKVSGVMGADEFVKDMEATFQNKFASKPQVIEGNMKAIKRAMTEVKGL